MKKVKLTVKEADEVRLALLNEMNNPTDCTPIEPFKVYVENVKSFENILKLFKDSDITDIEIRTHSNILFNFPPKTLEQYLNNFKVRFTTIMNGVPTFDMNNDVIIKIYKD